MTDNLFARLALARQEFHAIELKKSGRNKYADFDYFELEDFILPAMACLQKQGLVPVISYTKDMATMSVYSTESSDYFCITSPMVRAKYHKVMEDGELTIKQGASLKACHPIQNLGAVETYQRRYLWITLMEIMEHDGLDSTLNPADDKSGGKGRTTASRKQPLRPNKPKVDENVQPEGDGFFEESKEGSALTDEQETVSASEELVIETEQDAVEVTDLIIQFAKGQQSNSLANLTEQWILHKKVIDLLDSRYPAQYQRLKKAFTEVKAKIQQEKHDV